jgi:CBS domain-containing protein
MGLAERKVREIMETAVVTVQAEDPITKAADKMIRSRVHGLVVMRGQQPVAVISTFDMLKIVFLEKNRDTVTIEALLSKQELKSVGPFTSLEDAARLMVEHNIRTLPVIENGTLAGILSMMDILRQVV